MYEPSKTSLNCANRAPGRAPVETRDDMLLKLRTVLDKMADGDPEIESVRGRCRGIIMFYEVRRWRQWTPLKRRDGWCLSVAEGAIK